MTGDDPDQATWGALLEQAGHDPGHFAITSRWGRREKGRVHVVLALTGPGGRLIFKQIRKPCDPASFAAAMAAQDRAARALSHHPVARVPRIVAMAEADCAVLMEWAGNESLFSLCETVADHGPLLRRAGQWLAAFHRTAPQETRPFQPRFMADHLQKIAQKVRSDTSQVAARHDFLAHVAKVVATAPQAKDKPVISTTKHGDLNCRNLILGREFVWGIDFAPASDAPVGYDIARLLAHYAENCVDLDQLPPGRIIPAETAAAFFRGYDLCGPDDPVVSFLLGVRLLSDWASLPPDPDRMTVSQVIRLRRLQKLIANLMA